MLVLMSTFACNSKQLQAAGLTAASSILDSDPEPEGVRFSPATAVVKLVNDSHCYWSWRECGTTEEKKTQKFTVSQFIDKPR